MPCLKDVANGCTVYTVPWAVQRDSSGNLWIDESFSFSKNKGGTSTLKVTKDGDWWIIGSKYFNNKYCKYARVK